MDFVKNNRFWLMFGLVLLLPLIGWWLAASYLEAAVERRTTDLEGKFGAVESAQSGLVSPDFAKGLGKINDQRESLYEDSRNTLWQYQWVDQWEQEQLAADQGRPHRRKWPPTIRDLMQDVPYRGQAPIDALEHYRTDYFVEREKVLSLVRPFDPETETGVVNVSMASLPFVRYEEWEGRPISNEEMWDAQEDLWLLGSLLQAIDRVNGGESIITKAPIPQIDVIQFLGGHRVTDEELAAKVEQAQQGDGTEGEGSGRIMFNTGASQRFGGEGDGGQQGPLSVDFPIEQEITAKAETEAGSEENGSTTAAPGSYGQPGDYSDDSQQSAEDVRYVDGDLERPYKYRAFYMKLVIDNRAVPDLLVELTNTPWEVRILRVHQTEIHPDPIDIAEVGDGEGPDERFQRARPVQPVRPARPVRPMNRFEQDGPGSGESSGEGQIAAALENPALSQVVVAGLMTIYQPPGQKTPADDDAAQPDSDGGQAETDQKDAAEATPTADDPTTEDASEQPDAKDKNTADGNPASPESGADDAGTSDSDAARPDDSDADQTDADEDGEPAGKASATRPAVPPSAGTGEPD